jgi:RNA polymerase sigma-70 factor (ECF subfamily)
LGEEDRKLVERCQKGDPKAFRVLVERYQRRVFSIAFGLVHNKEDALDITQEAFVKVHRYIGNFQGSSSFYTWLYRIVINLCIDFLRKSSKTVAVDYDDQLQHGSRIEGDINILSQEFDENPAKVFKQKELGEQILKALDDLPGKHKEIILMREVDGMSYEDMARILKISKGTVMSRLFHARQKLQNKLKMFMDTT